MWDLINDLIEFDGATLSTEGLLSVALSEDVPHGLFSGCEHDAAVEVDGIFGAT